MPKKASFTTIPKETEILKYGGYLVNAAGCVDCHSKMDKGAIVEGTEFGGGMEFKFPQGIVRSVNITGDAETGIGSWSKDAFVKRFHLYVAPSYQSPKVEAGMNTPMPWTMYGGMKTSDLEAIYAYLRTVKPLKNQVVRFEPNSK